MTNEITQNPTEISRLRWGFALVGHIESAERCSGLGSCLAFDVQSFCFLEGFYLPAGVSVVVTVLMTSSLHGLNPKGIYSQPIGEEETCIR